MKIKVGKNPLKRRPFNLSHDVNTTCDWGFMQPTCKLDCIGDSTVRFTPRTFVRLHPMVAPTFGRALLKHYAYFVPKRDVMMSYENLMSETIFNGGSTSYIPTKEPYILVEQLSRVLLTSGMSNFTVYKLVDSTSNMHCKLCTEVEKTSGITELKSVYQITNAQGNVNCPGTYQTNEGRISIEGADFVLMTVGGSADNTYVFAFRLTKRGKNLRKIMIGLGYQPCFTDTGKEVSVLPLFAYYKSWFDLFAIKQKQNWQSTRCYKIIQYIALNNWTNMHSAADFYAFIRDIADECYYSYSPDYFTAHQDELNYMLDDSMSLDFVRSYESGDAVIGKIEADESSILADNSTSIRSAIGIKAALKYLPFVNKNSVIGQKIRSFFAAHGLGQVDDNKDSGYIGSVEVKIDISDVMSTAETTDGALGEYTGKGIGSTGNSAKSFKHDCKCAGYFIVLTTIVPRTNYVQGIDPTLFNLRQMEHYWPEFDALGVQVTDKLAFLGLNETAYGRTNTDRLGNFGVIPRYSEYKTKQSTCNGDISLRSTRAAYLPYTLDRWMTLNDFTVGSYHEDTSTYDDLVWHNVSTPQVNPELRFIGKNEFFGNFDRIFNMYNSEEVPLEDMFIVHNMFELTLIAPMKPMSDSFDTDEYENSMEIEKA